MICFAFILLLFQLLDFTKIMDGDLNCRAKHRRFTKPHRTPGVYVMVRKLDNC